jgi:hypothetical protein
VALENIAPVAPLPTRVVKTQQGGVYTDVRPLLVDFVSVAGTHSRDQRYPTGKLPFHLDIKIRRFFQSLQQLRNAGHAIGVPLEVASLEHHVQQFRITCGDCFLNDYKISIRTVRDYSLNLVTSPTVGIFAIHVGFVIQ